MKVVVALQFEVDPEKWAENNNGLWPEDDKRALNTAVRQDIKKHIKWVLGQQAIFEDCGVGVEVR